MTSKQITLSKIAQMIYDQAVKNPNILGEVLLDYTFVGAGRGCYSNFDLRPSFRLYTAGKDMFCEELLGHPDCPDGCYDEDVENIKSYIDPEIDLTVVYHWDGDGHLIFKLGDILIENRDIKKSNNWKAMKTNCN
jgi:hypothetical protein